MHKLLIALFCLISATAFAASPAFGDFNTNQFGVVGNKVVIKAGALITNGPIYVATTGSDANPGTLASPKATITNAATTIGKQGTIVVRGGNYHNQALDVSGARLTIQAFSNEVPSFYVGRRIPLARFTQLTNSIFTATLTAAEGAELQYLTNMWNANSPANNFGYIFQTNVPYGPSGGVGLVPNILSRRTETNRCEHTPLYFATGGIAWMQNTNAKWWASGNLLYVRPGVSNTISDIYIGSTNINESFVHHADAETQLKIVGIKSYFALRGFDLSDCSEAELSGCLAFGSGWCGIYAENTNGLSSQIKISHCEASAVNIFGILVNCLNGRVDDPWTQVDIEGCSVHDGVREGISAFGNANVSIRDCTVAYDGRHNNTLLGVSGACGYGYISSGADILIANCTSLSNGIGFQVGDVQNRRSRMEVFSSISEGDQVSGAIDDQNCTVLWRHMIFNANSVGQPVVFNGGSGHYVRFTGCMNLNQGSSGLDFYGGTIGASTVIVDPQFLGANTYVNAGTFYATGTDAAGGASLYIGAGAFKATAAGVLTTVRNITSVGTNVITGVVTNVVAVGLARGQVPLVINGVTYYIDLK